MAALALQAEVPRAHVYIVTRRPSKARAVLSGRLVGMNAQACSGSKTPAWCRSVTKRRWSA